MKFSFEESLKVPQAATKFDFDFVSIQVDAEVSKLTKLGIIDPLLHWFDS